MFKDTSLDLGYHTHQYFLGYFVEVVFSFSGKSLTHFLDCRKNDILIQQCERI